MKAFIVLFACVALARGGLVAPVLTGHSSQHRNQDIIGNYNFGYKEGHATGGTFREEAGDKFGNKVGSYGLQDADGRIRTVKYVADGHGFRAHINTNEPGTAAGGSAAALVNGPGIVKAAVGPIVAAPAVVAPVAVGYGGYGLGGGYGHGGYGIGGGYGHGGYGLGGGYGHGGYGGYGIGPVAAVSGYTTQVQHAAPVLAKAAIAPVAVGIGKGIGLGYGGLGYGGLGYGGGVY